jgi:hypothetical protein
MAANLVASPWAVDDIDPLVQKAEDVAPKTRGRYKPRAKKIFQVIHRMSARTSLIVVVPVPVPQLSSGTSNSGYKCA